MRIKVQKFKETENSTLSYLYVDDMFYGLTLEDGHRDQKEYGETRIPEGVYRVDVRREGGFHERYRKRFKDFHRGMLWLRDIPNFQYVLIHIGNFVRNTEGCILVAEDYGFKEDTGNYFLRKSVLGYKKLYQNVIESAEDGDLEIEMNREG